MCTKKLKKRFYNGIILAVVREIAFKQITTSPLILRYSSLKKGGEISLGHAFPLLIFLGGVPQAGWLINYKVKGDFPVVVLLMLKLLRKHMNGEVNVRSV